MQHDQVRNESKIGSQKIRNAPRAMLHGSHTSVQFKVCRGGKGGGGQGRNIFSFFLFETSKCNGKGLSQCKTIVLFQVPLYPLTAGSLNCS